MRLGFENVVLLAHSTGRTLVLPPKRQLEHGVFDKSGSKVVSFADFYDIDAINKQKGLDIITMEEFLEREGINGHLKNGDGKAIYPPNNQIQWNNHALKPLWDYIRSVSYLSEWHPRSCVSHSVLLYSMSVELVLTSCSFRSKLFQLKELTRSISFQ